MKYSLLLPRLCRSLAGTLYFRYARDHDQAPELFSSLSKNAALIAHGKSAAKAVEGVEGGANDAFGLVVIAHIVRRADEQASIPRFGALDGADDDGDAGNAYL